MKNPHGSPSDKMVWWNGSFTQISIEEADSNVPGKKLHREPFQRLLTGWGQVIILSEIGLKESRQKLWEALWSIRRISICFIHHKQKAATESDCSSLGGDWPRQGALSEVNGISPFETSSRNKNEW